MSPTGEVISLPFLFFSSSQSQESGGRKGRFLVTDVIKGRVKTEKGKGRREPEKKKRLLLLPERWQKMEEREKRRKGIGTALTGDCTVFLVREEEEEEEEEEGKRENFKAAA